MTDDIHQPWVEKYRPSSFDEIQGNGKAIGRIEDWARNFPADRRPRLLLGDPGVGKTTIAEVTASELDLQMVELNASAARTSEDIEAMASTIGTTNAEGERKVILLDEADSWHHASNKQPLYDALVEPANLVFITANDKWETPNAIVNRAEIEKIKLHKRSRKPLLRRIAEAEGIDLPEELETELAERPDGRAAINALQIFAPLGEIPEDQLEYELSEWDMVDAMLTGTPTLGGERPRDGIRPGEALMWLDENVKHEYRGLELAWAYEALGRADRVLMQDAAIAQEIVKSVARLRRTEPYYDDNIGRSKSFPEWFRHSKPTATDSSSEAALYRALSGFDDGEVGSIRESFDRFRGHSLPALRALDDEAKFELILEEGLAPEEYEALDITEAEYTAWLEEERPEAGEWTGETQAADGW